MLRHVILASFALMLITFTACNTECECYQVHETENENGVMDTIRIDTLILCGKDTWIDYETGYTFCGDCWKKLGPC